jgi:hypothetical protein
MNVNDLVELVLPDKHQAAILREFLQMGSQDWTTVWRTWGKIADGPSGSVYSCLMNPSLVPKAMQGPGWSLLLGDGRPGFSKSFDGEREMVAYSRITSDGIEPLVHVRLRNGRFAREVDISEEFRLLFDLRLGEEGVWYSIDEAGDEHRAVVRTGSEVRIRTPLVRRYQAVRQLSLILQIDSDLWSDAILELGEASGDVQEHDKCMSYWRGRLGPPEHRPFSRLIGKRSLAPPAIEDCGLWPYEAEAQYEAFVIGEDDVGRPIEHTSDPDQLANYFGKNAGAPDYITPVTFKREVLEKYYKQSDKYSVEDGYLRAGGYWGLRMDNDSSDRVTVMLGDLGRDLPYSEQKYWRSFNVADSGKFSAVAYRRGFLAQFAEAASPDLQFKRLYKEMNSAWLEGFGWPLFTEPRGEDAQLLGQLHVLMRDNQGEFDEQVLILCKLLVDSLNEPCLSEKIGPGPTDEKGIAKLGRFLEREAFSDRETVGDLLQEIQAIRSSGAAHRKGRRYEKLRAAAARSDRRQWFADLLERSLVVLETLRAFARTDRRAR